MPRFANVLLALLLASTALHAQAPRLTLVVILTRHGVRSPTWTQDRLNAYAAQPWPTWPVPPGELTPHGFQLIEQFGRYERANLASKGLFAAKGCAETTSVYIDADTDQRTLATGRALAQGLFPTCPPPLQALAEGTNDPLFHPKISATPAQAAAGLAELTERLNDPLSQPDPTLIPQLQRVLLGCTAQTGSKPDCTPARAPALLLSTDPLTAIPGKGDRVAELKGPLPIASTLSEDLLLEYADAMPAAAVGWGHVDEDQLRRFLALHTAYFDLLHRTPMLARLGNAEMLHHIEQTLQQAVEHRPIAGALGGPGQKLVILVGHDTNLAAVAALLGVHWTLDGRTDDTPPGTEVAFELWETPPSAAGNPPTYAIRTTVTMQTLTQMHDLNRATATPPVSTLIPTTGCPATGVCPWPTFLQAIEASVNATQ